jgi:hypothetical protein
MVNLPALRKTTGDTVMAVSKNMHNTKRGNASVPNQLALLLSELPDNEEGQKYRWECFILPTGEEVRPKSFRHFITGYTPQGLGASVEQVELWIKESLPDLMPIFRDSLAGTLNSVGRPKDSNVRITNNMQSDTATYTTARLKRDNPALAAKVINGELSPHAAAVQAGIRKPYKSFPVGDTKKFAAKMKREFSEAELQQIIKLLWA